MEDTGEHHSGHPRKFRGDQCRGCNQGGTISSAGKAASEATAKTVAAPATNTGTTNSAGKIPPQPQQQTAVQMAQDSPAQLAQLAAGGNTLAKHILAERAAANKLVAPPVTAK
jgi:hypothetical protein